MHLVFDIFWRVVAWGLSWSIFRIGQLEIPKAPISRISDFVCHCKVKWIPCCEVKGILDTIQVSFPAVGLQRSHRNRKISEICEGKSFKTWVWDTTCVWRSRTNTCKGIPSFHVNTLHLIAACCVYQRFHALLWASFCRHKTATMFTMRRMYEGRRAFQGWLSFGFSCGGLWLLLASRQASKVALRRPKVPEEEGDKVLLFQ